MEINEALRRTLGGHWRLILVLMLLPLLAVGALNLTAKHSYVATARVQASSTPPGSETEADAVLNRVEGIATSSTVLDQALRQVKLTGHDPNVVVNEIGVQRLGSSAVFNMTVTDPDPHFAVALAGALATQVVAFLDGAGSPQPTSLINQLNAREQSLLQQRVQTAASLSLSKNPVESANLSAQLSTIDQQLTSVQSSLQQLSTIGLASNSAAVIAVPTSAVRAPANLATDLGLAALIGLVAGLLVATVLEVVRPRVADSRSFAREFDVPVIGRLRRKRGADSVAGVLVEPEVRITLRRLALRGNLHTIVLTGPAHPDRLAALASHLDGELAESGTVVPAPENHTSNGHPHLGSAGSGGQHELASRTITLAPVLDVPPRVLTSLRVKVLTEVADTTDDEHIGVLAVVPNLSRYAEVRRLHDLLATTGWPMIGVLGDAVRSGKRAS